MVIKMTVKMVSKIFYFLCLPFIVSACIDGCDDDDDSNALDNSIAPPPPPRTFSPTPPPNNNPTPPPTPFPTPPPPESCGIIDCNCSSAGVRQSQADLVINCENSGFSRANSTENQILQNVTIGLCSETLTSVIEVIIENNGIFTREPVLAYTCYNRGRLINNVTAVGMPKRKSEFNWLALILGISFFVLGVFTVTLYRRKARQIDQGRSKAAPWPLVKDNPAFSYESEKGNGQAPPWSLIKSNQPSNSSSYGKGVSKGQAPPWSLIQSNRPSNSSSYRKGVRKGQAPPWSLI